MKCERKKPKWSIVKGKSVLQEQIGQFNVAVDWVPPTSRKDLFISSNRISYIPKKSAESMNGTESIRQRKKLLNNVENHKNRADLDLRDCCGRAIVDVNVCAPLHAFQMLCVIPIESLKTTENRLQQVISDLGWKPKKKSQFVLARSTWWTFNCCVEIGIIRMCECA